MIGHRPVDLYLQGFEALDAAARVHRGNVKVFVPSLDGATIALRGKSGTTVLGTICSFSQNVLSVRSRIVLTIFRPRLVW